MRALLLSNLFPTVGSPSGGIFVEHRIRSLNALGVEIDAVALRPRPFGLRFQRRNPLVSEVFTQVRIPVLPFEALDLKRGGVAWRSVGRAARALERRAQGADIVVGHGMYGLPAASVAAGLSRSLGIPSIAVFHGSDVNLNLRSNPSRAVGTLKGLDLAIFVSEALLTTARLAGYAGRSVVIPNGVDLDLFGSDLDTTQLKAELDLAPTTRLIAYAGNLLPIKGVDRLPDIVAELTLLRDDFHLAVMGDGPQMHELRSRTAHLPVTLLGRRSPHEVAALLSMADVVVLPSRAEGWPCVVMEALGSGAAVVGTNVGGVAEAIGEGGTVVDEGDGLVERFAAAVDRELRLRRSRASQRDRVRGYSWHELAARELAAWVGVT